MDVGHRSILIFGLYVLLTSIWSPSPGTSAIRAIVFLLIGIFIVETARLRWITAQKVISDLEILFGFAVALSALGGALALFGVQEMVGAYDRFKGLTVNADVAGWIAAIAFPVGYAGLFGGVVRRRIGFAFGSTVLCLTVLASGTRGALISLAGSVVLIHLMRVRRRRVSLWVSGTVGLAAIAVVVGAVLTQVVPSGRLPESSTDVSSGRFSLWRAGVALWERRPMEGWGFGMTSQLDGFAGRDGMSLHNAYLTVLLETGIVGIVIFVGVVVLAVAWRGRSLRPVVAAGAIAVLTNAFFESSLVNLGSPVTLQSWLVLGAVGAVGLRTDPTRSEAETGGGGTGASVVEELPASARPLDRDGKSVRLDPE